MAMQVAYSAGTTSHSPRCSPRCSPVLMRKSPVPSPRASPTPSRREWRPVMDGYRPPAAGQTHINQQHHQNHVTSRSTDSNLKDSIPAMPKCLAITCLICNILCPGLGTFLAGTTVYCCSKVRPKGATKVEVLRINSMVGLLQFLTAFILLLGWIWSIMWGASFLTISREEHYLTDADEESESNLNSGDANNRRSAGPSNNSSSKSGRVKKSKGSSDTPLIVLQRVATIIKGQQRQDTLQQDSDIHEPLTQAESMKDDIKTITDNVQTSNTAADHEKELTPVVVAYSEPSSQLKKIVILNHTSIDLQSHKNQPSTIISQKG